MVLHTQEAALEYAYECAHASDEYVDEEESLDSLDNVFFINCPCCQEPAFCVDGEWNCEGGC